MDRRLPHLFGGPLFGGLRGRAARARGARRRPPWDEPATAPTEKLDHVRKNNEHGYHAYERTPLVLGGLRLTCNVVALAITAVITAILVIGIRESAGFNAGMVLVKIGAVLFVIVAGIGYIDGLRSIRDNNNGQQIFRAENSTTAASPQGFAAIVHDGRHEGQLPARLANGHDSGPLGGLA